MGRSQLDTSRKILNLIRMNEYLNSVGTGIITGIISAIIASLIYDRLRNVQDKKPLTTILNFGKKDPLFFVLSLRTDLGNGQTPSYILKGAFSEDFLAINNIKSALLNIGWHGDDKVKLAETLDTVDGENLIFSIGSMKTNTFTEKMEAKINNGNRRFFRVVENIDPSEPQITDGHGYYPSKSYEEIKKYISANQNNGRSIDFGSGEYHDYGYITKISNPDNSKTKLFIIAGIRGIGTWGAAECLRTKWKDISSKLGEDKNSDFSALIEITYKNLDIIGTKVERVHVL
jgi:hypothetical protein